MRRRGPRDWIQDLSSLQWVVVIAVAVGGAVLTLVADLDPLPQLIFCVVVGVLVACCVIWLAEIYNGWGRIGGSWHAADTEAAPSPNSGQLVTIRFRNGPQRRELAVRGRWEGDHDKPWTKLRWAAAKSDKCVLHGDGEDHLRLFVVEPDRDRWLAYPVAEDGSKFHHSTVAGDRSVFLVEVASPEARRVETARIYLEGVGDDWRPVILNGSAPPPHEIGRVSLIADHAGPESQTMEKFDELRETTRPASVDDDSLPHSDAPRFEVGATPHIRQENLGRFVAGLSVTNLAAPAEVVVRVVGVEGLRDPLGFEPFEGRWEVNHAATLTMASGEGPKVAWLRRLVPKLSEFLLASLEGDPVWMSNDQDPVVVNIEVACMDGAGPPVPFRYRLGFTYPDDPDAPAGKAQPLFELAD